MGRSRTPLILAVLFLVFVALGSYQGQGLQELREGELFYRWLHSMASDVFLRAKAGQESANTASEDGESKDYALFARVVEKTAPVLGGSDQVADSTLVEMINNSEGDRQIWDLALSPELAGERADFQAYRSDDKLEFARNIDLASAQSSGVNLFNLFFGFRKVAANFVWMQVDQYWHMGMEHRMLPLMKTTVTLDPNFVDAYLVGAWHLAYNLTAKMEDTAPEEKVWLPAHEVLVGPKEIKYYEAVDYLQDGIRNNPRNFKLYFDLGFAIYKEKLKDYPNAVKYLEKAVSLPHERWVPRQLFICYEMNGQYERAQRGWEHYLEEFPENVNAPRFIERNKGLQLEEKGDDYLAQARGLENPSEARELRDQAVAAYNEAREVYTRIDDSFGHSKVSMVDAKLLALQDRYVEAIALLEYARLASDYAFDEASDLLMAYKQEAGIPLSLSEQMELERRSDLARVTAEARARAASEGSK